MSYSGSMTFEQNLEWFKPYEIEPAKQVIIGNNTEIIKWHRISINMPSKQ